MWPIDLPAREVLKLPGEAVAPWAVFDAAWYVRTYPEAAALDGGDPMAVLGYYLDRGRQYQHSPNRLFDESWHRTRYPHIAEKVRAGHWTSAFDSYCRGGALDRSPHWLFDEVAYRERYPDLTRDVLEPAKLFNGYDHYLRHGARENRIGHVLFDPAVYLANFDPADADAIREQGVFQHYLARIETGEPELRTSAYFDPAWYRDRYPEVARDIDAGQWTCALHHYLCNDTPTAFDPLESFSEAWYLRRDRGLLEAVASRSFRNGYMHFLRWGVGELRPPNGSIDLAWYAEQPSVRADLDQGRSPDAFTHWLTIGAAAGLPSTKPVAETVTAGQAQQLFQYHADALLPIAGRFGYDFHCPSSAQVSAVMVVRDGFAATMATIASLRSEALSDIELIIIDRGSEDETRAITQYVPGAQVLRFESDFAWSRGADAGRQFATAPAVLFLSSAARIAPGSVERALARLAADPTVGAVGAMLLQPHGRIAQSGGILWQDGRIHDYMQDSAPLEPEANFVRQVDFCAADFLMVRTSLLAELDGFDHDCGPGYETVDLCLRIAQAGSRVVYDPSVMIALAAPRPESTPSEHFLRKHATALTEQFASSGPIQIFARHTGACPHRVLFIEDTVPVRRIGSGFVRANDLLRVMSSLGYAVTVFPVNGSRHALARVFGDMPEHVEVMHTLDLDRLEGFLKARAGYYDTIWVARMHNLTHVRPILTRALAEGVFGGRVVLDTEALTPRREAIQAELAGEAYDLDAAMRALLADADICQRAVAVTASEAGILREHGFASVEVIGHMIEPTPTPKSFVQRSGILFLGASHRADSPNMDSLLWFVDAVLPLVEAELKWDTRLTIAGYTAPGIDLSRFEQHPRITLHGPVADPAALYDAHRVFVAPTRFAAGAPYKVLEAAAYGLPVAATTLLGDELGWSAGTEILVAGADDPRSFAANILALYRDESLWWAVREGALHRLRQDNGLEAFARAISKILGPGADG